MILQKDTLIILLVVLLVCVSCSSNEAPVINSVENDNQASEEPVLIVYNWEDYFGEDTIERFEQQTGIEVRLETFVDENIMLSSVQSQPDAYDVIIASGIMIEDMHKMRLLRDFDEGSIPNLVNIDSEYAHPYYDRDLKFSAPYMWGTTGIIINTKFVNNTGSWGMLWNESYAGRAAMLNEADEVILAALLYEGLPLVVDDSSKAEISDILSRQSDIITGFDDVISIRDKMISEELWLAHSYSGEALFAMDENDNLLYVIPKEGASVWIDNLAIPIDAPHPKNAQMFINFILDERVSADIANYLWYANTNAAAAQFTDPEILEDESLYPSDDVRNKLVSWDTLRAFSQSTLNSIWEGLK